MIDLSKRTLPDFVEVNGNKHKIKTDFRVWLSFGEFIKNLNDRTTYDFDFYYGTLEDGLTLDTPEDRQKGIEELMKFYNPPQPLPRPAGNEGNAKVVDFTQDSDLIYAAFHEVYGIDLLTAELHWWQFLALFRGLHGTKLNDVMSYRCYDENDKTEWSESMKQLRGAWALEEEITEEQKEAMEKFESDFE